MTSCVIFVNSSHSISHKKEYSRWVSPVCLKVFATLGWVRPFRTKYVGKLQSKLACVVIDGLMIEYYSATYDLVTWPFTN